ncbi:MAG: diguanylate cyclase domain-containing protein [bacterium]
MKIIELEKSRDILDRPLANLRIALREVEDKPIKVLLIEDNPGDARLIREMLTEAEMASFDVEWVDRLSTGLERLARGGINVLLVDLSLPDSRGLETFTKVHIKAPTVPIIVLTGLDDEAVGVRAVREGVQDYLVKGKVDSHLLRRAIRYAIERKKTEETIRHMAYHDSLTGLPNRALFNDRLTLAMAHAQRNCQKLAVMLLDLDYFKEINDTLGHTVGDELLQSVGNRLKSILRKSDTIARFGGDEFLLLLPEIAGVDDATKIAQKILEALRQQFVLDDGHKLRITTSIGIAIYPNEGEDTDTLMKNADIAMYRAKEQGRNNYHCYTPSLKAQAIE